MCCPGRPRAWHHHAGVRGRRGPGPIREVRGATGRRGCPGRDRSCGSSRGDPRDGTGPSRRPADPAKPAVAADPTPTPLVTGWLPSWATDAALAGVEANADLIGEASPFWYTAKASGGAVSVSTTMSPDTVAGVVARLRAKGITVIPSVADGSAAKAMAAVISDPAARAAHVNQLVERSTVNGFDGIELDYEKFAFSDGTSTWATTRPAWVAFVTELGTALHGAGKQLALAVPPMYDGTYTSSSGYWVYDYAGVAPVVDSLRIMTYDYSSPARGRSRRCPSSDARWPTP